MRIIKIIPVLILIALQSCAQKDFKTYINGYYEFSVDTIGVNEFKKIQKSSKIIDARSTEEYTTSKIKGAVFVDYDNPQIDALSFAKDDTIVVYCTIGYRSEKIAEKLKEKGYKNVFNLYGGIVDWVNKDNPVCSPMGNNTNYVHTYDESWGKWVINPKFKKVH